MGEKMVAICVVSAVVALGLGSVACGGTSTGASQAPRRSASAVADRTTASQTRLEVDTADDDSDSSGNLRYDVDDRGVVDSGHVPDAASVRAIVALVKRYFAVAAAGNGVQGCALVYGYLLVSETIAEEYRLGSSPTLNGRTCATYLSRIFKRHHRNFAARAAARVGSVRTVKNDGAAMLRLKGPGPEHHELVRRVHGVWRIASVFDVGMP
jgi:hypothetical protein